MNRKDVAQWLSRGKQWLYHDNRPNCIARVLNRGWATLHSSGLLPRHWMTLEVIGRTSGRTISLPVVVAVVNGQRYLVSMLGEHAQWVSNVRASHGRAVLQRRGRERVDLWEMPAEQRAPILKAYLHCAPGARPHVPLDKDAPLEAFEQVASTFPIFQVVSHAE